MYHPVLAKAHILRDLEQLRSQASIVGGCSAQDRVDIEVLVRDALAHGLVAPPPGSTVWDLAASYVQAASDCVPPCLSAAWAADGDAQDTPSEEPKPLAQGTLEVWIAEQAARGCLVSRIRALSRDKARTGELYAEWAILRVRSDLVFFLNLLDDLTSMATIPPSDKYTNILFSKNNVSLTVSGPPAPESPASEGEGEPATPAGDSSGYLCVCSNQPLDSLEAATAEAPSHPADVRLLWTPNQHFTNCNDSRTALPPGWDEGYDPVTGHRYYIHHQSRTTTWDDPRLLNGAASCGPSLSPGQLLGSDVRTEFWHPLPAQCTCDAAFSVPNAQRHACSIFVDVTAGETISVSLRINEAGEGPDACVLTIRPDLMHPSLRGYREPLRFRMSRGAASLQRVLRQFTYVILDDGRSVDDTLRSPSASLSAPALTRRVRRRARTLTPGDPRRVSGSFSWPKHVAEPAQALQASGLSAFQDNEGRIVDWSGLRKLIFFRGIHSDLRSLVWKFLLGVYPRESTRAEREAIKERLHSEYWERRRAWMGLGVFEAKELNLLVREISKDVVRTDRDCAFFAGFQNPNLDTLLNILITYAYFNPELRYSQGISDLLSPILLVMRDEAEAFWCLVALLERVGDNFDPLGAGMHSKLDLTRLLVQAINPALYDYLSHRDVLNMFFCYRWLLLDFKREFPIFEVMRVWDTIWAGHRTDHFDLFVAVAILDLTSTKLLQSSLQPDEILEFFNGLAMSMSVVEVLNHARTLVYKFSTLEAVPEAIAGLLRARPAVPEEVDVEEEEEEAATILGELTAEEERERAAVAGRVAQACAARCMRHGLRRVGRRRCLNAALDRSLSFAGVTPGPDDPADVRDFPGGGAVFAAGEWATDEDEEEGGDHENTSSVGSDGCDTDGAAGWPESPLRGIMDLSVGGLTQDELRDFDPMAAMNRRARPSVLAAGQVRPVVDPAMEVAALLHVRLALQHDENEGWAQAVDNYLVAVDALLSSARGSTQQSAAALRTREQVNELVCRVEYLKATHLTVEGGGAAES